MLKSKFLYRTEFSHPPAHLGSAGPIKTPSDTWSGARGAVVPSRYVQRVATGDDRSN